MYWALLSRYIYLLLWFVSWRIHTCFLRTMHTYVYICICIHKYVPTLELRWVLARQKSTCAYCDVHREAFTVAFCGHCIGTYTNVYAYICMSRLCSVQWVCCQMSHDSYVCLVSGVCNECNSNTRVCNEWAHICMSRLMSTHMYVLSLQCAMSATVTH